MHTLLMRTLLIIGAIAFLFPSGVLAQGKEYKIFTIDEYVKMDNPDPGKRYRLEILTDKDNATKMGGIVILLPAKAPQ